MHRTQIQVKHESILKIKYYKIQIWIHDNEKEMAQKNNGYEKIISTETSEWCMTISMTHHSQ